MIKVLIIEDDPMVANINKLYLLKVPGFSLAGIVHSGTEALNFLSENSRKVDLILLDVFMPQMDGLSFLRELKLKSPDIDVIMVTAAQSVDSVRAALSRGVVDYIIKPFTYERMSVALNSYRSRYNILRNNKSLEQTVLDKEFFSKESTSDDSLPKSVEAHTLCIVKDRLAQQIRPCSTQELAEIIGISRVSLRKYLIYLENMGDIKSTLTYRHKGRPTQMYQYVGKNDI